MSFDRIVPLTFRAIRLILDRDAALRALSAAEPTSSDDAPTAWPSDAMLPSGVVRALEVALRGRLVGTDSYPVRLTLDDAKALVAWCRELARGSRPEDRAVLRVAAPLSLRRRSSFTTSRRDSPCGAATFLRLAAA
jgi:hypothetical protein